MGLPDIGSKPASPAPKVKPESVHIKGNPIPVMIPARTGGMNLMILGLGDDDKIYLWDSNKLQWMDR